MVIRMSNKFHTNLNMAELFANREHQLGPYRFYFENEELVTISAKDYSKLMSDHEKMNEFRKRLENTYV